MSTSGACLNSDGFSGEFPTLRLLVVDDDPTCLKLLERMLKKCQYEVTTCDRAEVALSLLRENKNRFHLVISDVHMPGMDGFKLLDLIALEMKLPVIMMSADENRSVVLRGVIHGAHDYLVKPVKIEQLKNIWQHVVRQNKDEWKDKIIDQSGNVEQPKDVEYSCAVNEARLKRSKNRKEEENDTTVKKARVLWTEELHAKFVQAFKQTGMERVCRKHVSIVAFLMDLFCKKWGDVNIRIQCSSLIEAMTTDIPNDDSDISKPEPKKILQLMNVPGLKREHVASHLQKYRMHLKKIESGLYNAFMEHSEVATGRWSNISNLHALAPNGQLAAQNLAALPSETWLRPAQSPIYIPSVGQRNHFGFENPMLRYQGQQQQMNNDNKQVHFHYGIPTTVEQNSSLNFTAQQNESSVARICQPQLRAQNMLSESNQVQSRNGILDNARCSMYNQVPQAYSALDFSSNQNTQLAGNNFSLSVDATPANFPLSGFSTMSGLQNVESIFDASYRSSIQHGIFSMEQNGQNVNAPSGQEIELVNTESDPGSSYQIAILPETFGQEDLMSVLLEQQQQETPVGPVEYVFDDDADAWDLPM